MITAIKDPLVDLTALNDCVDEEPAVNNSNSKVNNLANQNMIRRYLVLLNQTSFSLKDDISLPMAVSINIPY